MENVASEASDLIMIFGKSRETIMCACFLAEGFLGLAGRVNGSVCKTQPYLGGTGGFDEPAMIGKDDLVLSFLSRI